MSELALIAPLGAIEAGAGAGAAAAGLSAAGLSSVGAAAYAAVTSGFTLSSLFTGASLAWSIGSSLVSLFGGPAAGAGGPRLSNLHPQSAAFGQPIKRFWGVDRMAGQLIWIGSDGKGGRGVREHKHEISGGKGKGGSATPYYTYDVDFAISINGASNCKGVLRIWDGPKLIYDVRSDTSLQSRVGSGWRLNNSSGATVLFYDGDESQQPPALIEALAGVGNTSAYRNQFLAVFQNYDVTDHGGQIPQLSFECYTDGEKAFEELESYNLNAKVNLAPAQASWSFVDPNGEIVIMTGAQNKTYTSLFTSGSYAGDYVVRVWRALPSGELIPEDRPPAVFVDPADTTLEKSIGGNFITGHSDEPLMACANGGKFWIIRPDQPIVTLSNIKAWNFFSKKGDVIYLAGSGAWVQALQKWNAVTGDLMMTGDGAALFSTFVNLADIMVGDDYLWALHHSRTSTDTDKLYKLDLDTLEIVGTVDLGTKMFVSFFVDSDNLIYLLGNSAGNVVFYKWEDAVLTSLGSWDNPGLSLNGTLVVRNGIWYVGSYGQWGYFDTTLRVFAPGSDGNCVPLWQIVRDICIAEGMDESDIDVSELTDCVRGYTLDQQMSGRDAILPLQRYGFFDGRDSDLLLDFPKRGHDAVATIPEDDLAARPSLDTPLPDAVATTRGQETELPVIVHVRFKDQDANYETGHAYSARLTSESKNVLTIDVPVVMTADKAQQICWVLMADYWLERAPKEILLSRKYMALDAADPINLERPA